MKKVSIELHLYELEALKEEASNQRRALKNQIEYILSEYIKNKNHDEIKSENKISDTTKGVQIPTSSSSSKLADQLKSAGITTSSPFISEQ